MGGLQQQNINMLVVNIEALRPGTEPTSEPIVARIENFQIREFTEFLE